MLYMMAINPPVYDKTNTQTVLDYETRIVTFHMDLLQGGRGRRVSKVRKGEAAG